jgi:hypothetical protein
MKTITLSLFIFYSISIFAALSSPFVSTVDELSINNSHYVDSSKRIIRGMSPHGKINELNDIGITDILIFKNQTRTEIDDELKEIAVVNPEINVVQIEFLWHAYPSYKKACEKTIDALKLLKKVRFDSQRKIFFHCTVGEDRTGYLAGLYRMLVSRWNAKKAFYGEMCENGYANGNPNKPDYVVSEIRDDLSPLFTYMSGLIDEGKLSLNDLNKSYCTDRIGFQKINYCRTSSKEMVKDN